MNWNTLPLRIDPVIFNFGDFSFRWYSLGYFLAIFTLFWLVNFRLKKKELPYFNDLPHIKDRLLFVFSLTFLGMFLGAKLGYALFYDWQNFLSGPLETLSPFSQGKFVGFFGLSFHGGLIGAFLGSFLACRKENLSWFQLTNLVVPIFPLAYFWGRIGNFFNGELFGKITPVPWGMYFPVDPFQLRHPSQLYEALGEGILLFLILWPIRNRTSLQNRFFFIYLFLYGIVRFFLEFFRQEPFWLWNTLTKGQFLCLIMMAIGIIGYYRKSSFARKTGSPLSRG